MTLLYLNNRNLIKMTKEIIRKLNQYQTSKKD